MITNFLITGDCHGKYDRFYDFYALNMEDTIVKERLLPPEKNVAFICLGDFGINFYLDNSDKKRKRKLSKLDYIFYIVRGNHDYRPEHLPNIKRVYDFDVCGDVCLEEEYPNIRYLIDGETYKLWYQVKENDFIELKTLVLGGAYSIDKELRLEGLSLTDRLDPALCAKHGWFMDEQLSEEEKNKIIDKVDGKKFDIILSHTCPLCYEPWYLFVPQVSQEKVDRSTEQFLSDVKDRIKFKYWWFGHFHDDQVIEQGVRLFYKDIIPLECLVGILPF